MPRWLRALLILTLFAPVALIVVIMACEALPATRGRIAELIDLRSMWVAGTVYCLACIALVYQDAASRS